MLICAGGIFPAICFIEKKKKASCFIVKGVSELGLPSSLLLFFLLPCFSLLLSFSFASIPPFFFSFPQTENDVCCLWGIDCVLSARLTHRQLHVVPR